MASRSSALDLGESERRLVVEGGVTKPVRVAFQGEPGAFSEEAAVQLLGEAITTVPRATFVATFHAIADRSQTVPGIMLPFAPGVPIKVGLGLWNHAAATILVESAMFAAGVWVYARTTRARDRMGRVSFWIYVAALAAIYAANLAAPPPPDPHSLAVFALRLWLLPLWAAWVDRHRVAAIDAAR